MLRELIELGPGRWPRRHATAGAREPGERDGPGRRLPSVRLPARRASSGWAAGCSTTSAASLLEIEGAPAAVDDASAPACAREAPPLAVIERVAGARPRRRPASAASRSSSPTAAGEPDAPVSPDIATCADCLAELFDPADRRYRYPFTNCTNCGPRFTIVARRPLRPPADDDGRLRDVRAPARPSTRTRSTAASTPSPTPARMRAAGGCSPTGDGASPWPPAATRSRRPPRRCAAGPILAVKGIGGYHLACRAADERAVAALRARKHREDKPFALMAPDLEAARALVELTPTEEGAAHRPRSGRSCIARRRAGARVARRGRAGLARPRRDAALLAAAPPAARRRRASRW